MIQDIFKVGVYWVDLDLNTKAVSDYCISYSKKNKSRQVSNVGGYHSEPLQCENPVLNDLFLEIEKHTNLYSQSLGFTSKGVFDTVWININGYKDYNAEHQHPHCRLSGVYYAKTPTDCGDITFFAPHFDVLVSNWWNLGCTTQYTFQEYKMPAVENRLYIFPNWLRHMVDPNLNKKEKRISISFNLD